MLLIGALAAAGVAGAGWGCAAAGAVGGTLDELF
jgi:hypothetical protein